MKSEYLRISGIPAILWGEPSEKLFIFVHGENSSKESAEDFARIVGEYGYMTLSFDLPGCGERANICSACVVEPCDLFHAARDLTVIYDYACTRWGLSLCAKGKSAGFSAAAFDGKRFETCIFDSPDIPEDRLRGLSDKVSIGFPTETGFESFIRSSL